MIKKLLVALLSLLAAAAFAAVDVNKASQADLESIKGIGPVIAAKILDERKKASFKDWNDMVVRVKGVGERNAAKFSSEGLTVDGQAFTGAPAAAKKDTTAKKEKSAKSEAAPKSGTAKSEAATKSEPAIKSEAATKTEPASGKMSRAERKAAKKTAAAASAVPATSAKK